MEASTVRETPRARAAGNGAPSLGTDGSPVFALLTATFLLLGIGDAAENKSIVELGGYVGIATAIAAWYASFAAVVNDTFKRIVLPVKDLKG
jgi:succinate-acetate transporter protein